MSYADSDKALYNASLLTLFLIAQPTFISLRFLQAPYGKHHRPGWAPPPSLGSSWNPQLYGSPSTSSSSLAAATPLISNPSSSSRPTSSTTSIALSSTPFASSAAPYPISVASMAFGFNCLNAYLQARSVSNYEDYEADEWFWWRFVRIFGFGMRMNVKSDAVLVGLKSGGGGYKIPRGGWFEAVSCPNYLGVWSGWAGL